MGSRTKWERYCPHTIEEKLGYLVEECGEVLAAVGKALRHGIHSTNPELPEDQQETNGDWILRELRDLERAIGIMRAELREIGFAGATSARETE